MTTNKLGSILKVSYLITNNNKKKKLEITQISIKRELVGLPRVYTYNGTPCKCTKKKKNEDCIYILLQSNNQDILVSKKAIKKSLHVCLQ